MLEIVFSESAAGSMAMALSVGNIDEDGIGLNRESSLRLLMGTYPDIAEETVETSLRNASQGLAALLKRVEDGEPIRIWSSNNPDDACGLHWLMEQLRPLGFDRLHVTLVMFPAFEKQTDGAVLQHIAWGEIEPYRWGRMAKLGKKLSATQIRALSNHWSQLRKENSPLRAVLNGQLVSAPENFYDSFILRDLTAQNHEFMEGAVVGNVLSKYRLGIGDAWRSRLSSNSA